MGKRCGLVLDNKIPNPRPEGPWGSNSNLRFLALAGGCSSGSKFVAKRVCPGCYKIVTDAENLGTGLSGLAPLAVVSDFLKR